MLLWYFTKLTSYGSGYVFPYFLADIVACIGLCILIGKVIVPAIRRYRFGKALDKLFNTNSRHWFYGHSNKYGTSPKGFLAVSRLSKKFPSTFNLWIGPLITTISCYHPDTTISVLGSGAPKSELAYYFLRSWLGDGLLTSGGKKWHRNRRLLTPAFHYKILQPYNKIFNQCARVLIKKWKNQVGNPVDVNHPLSLLTLDTMIQCAMSQTTDCQNVSRKHPYIEAVHEFSTLLAMRFSKPYFLLDWIFYRTEPGKRFKKATDTLHQYTKQIIRQRREAVSKQVTVNQKVDDVIGFKKRDKQLLDFLDILLQTKDEDGKGLSESEIQDEVDTFLFEGHDTTASGLSWTIYNLAKHSNLQQRCRKEVLSIIGAKEDIEWEDLSKLSYLTMFIKESMRLHAPVPIISRKLNKPLQLSHSQTPEKKIPTGANVDVHIFSQHRNSHVWENPLVFDPERFTPENIAKRPAHAYIPFSAGSRNCIGQVFAMNEIKVVVAQLLRSFYFYLDEDTPEPILVSRLVLRSESGINVKFREANLVDATA